jgi:uncharacterized protein (DUF885 family)
MMNHRLSAGSSRLTYAALLVGLLVPGVLSAQARQVEVPKGWSDEVPELSSLVAFARGESDLRVAVDRYVADRAAIRRRYEVAYSPVRRQRLRDLAEGWQKRLRELDFDALNQEGKIDYILLRNNVEHDLATLRQDEERWKEMAPLLPFADRIRLLQEDRHDRKRLDPATVAKTVDDLAKEVRRLTTELAAEARRSGGLVERKGITLSIAARAAGHVTALRRVLADWNTFYDGYDPLFSWWVREPYAQLEKALTGYATALREHMVGESRGELAPIIGDPEFAEGLRADLAVEMIPYTAEELINIGWQEFEWIENQFKIVAREMGYGDDYMAAIEHTKNLALPPGEKPWAIFDIAKYSEEFIEKHDMVTMPPLTREVWRLAMQTPERQLVNPFFTGGEVTRVSYPTDGMTHEDKLMSMRGNTPHFNFATVHHELIPGHHLQGFMTSRFNSHRGSLQRTPFWGEGWALYWELHLWDRDFPRNDPDKIGMLFWRMHRAARIVFSLNFHLGKWTPQQAIDFLVDRVGHERANAEAEVRRSFLGNYSPLYQIAYLTGGLQFRALYKEMVESGRMTEREFHDAVLQGGTMPVELVRARITGQKLTRDYKTQWRFYGTPKKSTRVSD